LPSGWRNTVIEVDWLPEKLYFEGEGDALFGDDVLFCGYKFRSDIHRIAP
jgi:N-dimethylarginine dimethylaminohydrolase